MKNCLSAWQTRAEFDTGKLLGTSIAMPLDYLSLLGFCSSRTSIESLLAIENSTERELMSKTKQNHDVRAVMKPGDILNARELIDDIYIDNKVQDYIVDLVMATREPEKYGVPVNELIQYGVDLPPENESTTELRILLEFGVKNGSKSQKDSQNDDDYG
jgi:hypothetical protein